MWTRQRMIWLRTNRNDYRRYKTYSSKSEFICIIYFSFNSFYILFFFCPFFFFRRPRTVTKEWVLELYFFTQKRKKIEPLFHFFLIIIFFTPFFSFTLFFTLIFFLSISLYAFIFFKQISFALFLFHSSFLKISKLLMDKNFDILGYQCLFQQSFFLAIWVEY